jgi:uncharacterized protein (TIGR02246 family)
MEAIESLVAAAVRHQSDPEPFLALHTDDAVVVNIAGRRVLGREELALAMKHALAGPLADVTTTVDIDDVRFLRPDVAIVSCTKHVRDDRAGGDELPTTGTMTYVVVDDGGEALLAGTLVELADTLVEDFDVVDLPTRLADRCVEILDVDAAGIMLAAPDRQLRVMASSSEAMRVLELFEIQAREGPCLDSHSTGQPIVNQDLATVNGRWPNFAPVALAAGFRSVHALPMRLRGTVIGALNLFRTGTGEMTAADVDVAQAFADVATIAILQHRAAMNAQVLNDQLTYALNSRIVIEQSKGMIAERLELDMEESFAVLRGHARSHNLRLVDVAEAVIAGTLAPSALDPLRRDRS